VATSLSYTLAAAMVLVPFHIDSGLAYRDALVPKDEDVRFVWNAMLQAAHRYGMPRPIVALASRASAPRQSRDEGPRSA